MPRSPSLPLEVHTPSGRRLRLEKGEGREVSPTLQGHVEALSGAVVRVSEVGKKGAFVLDELALEDFHVLRTVVTALGLLPEAEVQRACRNCGDALALPLSRSVPLGPFLDGELDDPELDEPFDFEKPHDLPMGDAGSVRIRLRPLVLREAEPLFAALAADDPRRIGRALGVISFDGERDVRRIARKMSKLPDDAWERLVDLFESAHYPPRLSARIMCGSCDAENLYLAPRLREFPELDDATKPLPEPADLARFPSPDAFFAAVTEHGQQLTQRMGASGVPILVEEGVPHVDDGGQPLLGSFTPPLDGEAPEPPTVRLYYRTFRAKWLEEGPYDVDAEIHETIEHELTHYLAFLRGHDETDEEERAEIVRERRRVLGKREASEVAPGTVWAGLRRTWPLWAILVLLVALTYLSEGK